MLTKKLGIGQIFPCVIGFIFLQTSRKAVMEITSGISRMNSKVFCFIFILLFVCFSGWAEERQKEQKFNFVHYKKQSYSLIPWNELNERAWLDFREWKRDRAVREVLPQWEKAARDAKLIETVGRVIDCVGTCSIFHDAYPTQARFRSEILEGDEVVTKDDSYAWLYLMDGTLVRLSARSSISLKEINVSGKDVFFHARINYGNVLWFARDMNFYQESDLTETDQLFLPLTFYKANYYPALEKKEDDLVALIEGESPSLKQYKKLNQLIEENNKKIEKGVKRSSHAFLVMPNGTVFGKKLRVEFVVLVGGESYFKNRSFKMYNSEVIEDDSTAQFFYRGFDNTKTMEIENNRWYKVDSTGRELDVYDETNGDLNLYISEYLTSRIPTILLAREYLWKEYSDFTYKKLNAHELGAEYNYRLWENLFDEKSDLTLRLEFLKEHTRRVETTQLRLAEQFKKKSEERGDTIFQMGYDDKYYGRAMQAYLFKRGTKDIKSESENLNSTKKRFWELINGRR